MKRKVSRILSLSMALVLMGSFDPLHAFAQEYEAEEDFQTGGIEISLADEYGFGEDLAIGDLEFSIPEGGSIEADLETIVKGFKDEINGDVVTLHVADEMRAADMEDGIQAYAASQERALNYGTVSGYLSETGAYALYNLNLSAGNYLQARLTVPNNVNVNYALVLFDSELNVLKLSDYATCLNGGQALEESVGYLCASDELIYIGVLSLLGGSTTEPFTLDFSVTTEFSENGEPNENVQEAAALSLGNSGATVSGKLNSPVDNDWYSFTVIDSPRYYKTRLGLTSSSSTNGCKMEIYRNVGTENLSMQLIESGSGEAEMGLPTGTYYIRVVSTNTFGDFNPGDIPTYNLSVVPVSKADGIKITKYMGYNGAENVAYPQGNYYRIDDQYPNWITIIGIAYSTDSMNNMIPAANVKLGGGVGNNQWEAAGYPDIARTYGSAVTRTDGWFTMTISLNPALGGLSYNALVSRHYYDFMSVYIWLESNSKIYTEGNFYLLESCVPYI